MDHKRHAAFAATLALALAPAGWAANGGHRAEFLGGTVKTVPDNAAGTLDLSDSSDLEFSYDSGSAKASRRDTYKVPYRSIRSFDLPTAANFKTIAHLPVPVVRAPFLAHPQVLNIAFQQEDGTAATASFRVSGTTRAALERTLTERMAAAKRMQARAKNKEPEAWWGDRLWRTNRNKPLWQDGTSEADRVR